MLAMIFDKPILGFWYQNLTIDESMNRNNSPKMFIHYCYTSSVIQDYSRFDTLDRIVACSTMGYRQCTVYFPLYVDLFFPPLPTRFWPVLTLWVTRQSGAAYPSWIPGFTLLFLLGSVLLISLVFCILFVLIVLVLCVVPSVVCVSWLSILHYPFGFRSRVNCTVPLSSITVF